MSMRSRKRKMEMRKFDLEVLKMTEIIDYIKFLRITLYNLTDQGFSMPQSSILVPYL
jgi:hypothetical protein